MSNDKGLVGKISRMDRKAKAGMFYLFGNMFNKAISFLVLPIFTRLLTTEEYGLVSTYLSIESILSTFIALNLGNTVRNAYVDYKNNLDDYMSTMFITGYISSFIISVLFYIVNIFANIINPGYLVLMCCVQACMSGFIGSLAMRYMMNEEYVKRTLILVLPNLIVTIVSVVVLLIVPGNRYIERVTVCFFVYAVAGIILSARQIIRSKNRFNVEYVKYALPLAVPVIFHTLSTVILSQSDRTMITALYSASETGIYSVVYNFGMVALVLTTSAENVWIPWFTQRMISHEEENINRIAKIYLLLISIVVVAIMFISPDILVFMAGKKYEVGIALIPPIIIASFFIFLASFCINLEYYYKNTVYIAKNTIISGIVNIAMNFLLIPRYGGLAAAFTTVAAYAVNFILHYFNSRKLNNHLFPIKIYIVPMIIMACGGVIYYVTMDSWVIRWVLGLSIGIYILVKYRDKLVYFVRSK